MRTILLALLLFSHVSFGQSVATGNISAEVVDEILLLNDNTPLDQKKDRGEIELTFSPENQEGLSVISLKNLMIKPQEGIAFDLIFEKTSIKDNKGNESLIVGIESQTPGDNGVLREEITIQLKEKPESPLPSGFYKGTCPITFAFN